MALYRADDQGKQRLCQLLVFVVIAVDRTALCVGLHNAQGTDKVHVKVRVESLSPAISPHDLGQKVRR